MRRTHAAAMTTSAALSSNSTSESTCFVYSTSQLAGVKDQQHHVMQQLIIHSESLIYAMRQQQLNARMKIYKASGWACEERVVQMQCICIVKFGHVRHVIPCSSVFWVINCQHSLTCSPVCTKCLTELYAESSKRSCPCEVIDI